MRVLSRTDQKKIVLVAVLQIFMSILDLLGVLAIGLLGALSVSGLQSKNPGERITSVLEFLNISEEPFQSQIAILGLGALFFLVGRTILSIFFTRRILFFLSRCGAQISSNIISRLLAQPLLVIQERTTQETAYAVTTGVSLITLQVIATSVVLVSDVSLLFVMGIGLFLVDPATALATFIVFSTIGFLLYQFMHVRAGGLGVLNSQLSIASHEKIVEVFDSYRESVVGNRRHYYAREIGKLRFRLANVSAESAFMPYVSKYVIETAVVVGALLIAGAQFALQDATRAVATLAVFLAAGTRIAPAILRVQQGSIQVRNGLGGAASTLDLIDSLGEYCFTENTDDFVNTEHRGFIPEVKIVNVSLTYPNKPFPAISDVTLDLPAGSSVAIVGPSGAGKTTLIDALLGVLNIDSGNILISGMTPLQAISRWPGAISYVPQDVVISSGSIRDNVALGFPQEFATDDLVMRALKVADLDKFVDGLVQGLDTQVGERGAKISGGQRQRLGIARAMFTQPLLLVLDEATSSLDAETETSISKAIQSLRGTTTVVMIAHRLSTVRNADIVVYLSEGRINAVGTFDEVRALIPNFNRQATLMGL
jgi:ABC-type multidrug transport system fused ATPase/permease subunit